MHTHSLSFTFGSPPRKLLDVHHPSYNLLTVCLHHMSFIIHHSCLQRLSEAWKSLRPDCLPLLPHPGLSEMLCTAFMPCVHRVMLVQDEWACAEHRTAAAKKGGFEVTTSSWNLLTQIRILNVSASRKDAERFCLMTETKKCDLHSFFEKLILLRNCQVAGGPFALEAQLDSTATTTREPFGDSE